MRDVLAEEFLNLSHFLNGSGLIGGDEVVEQFIDVADISCHTMFQDIVGIRFVAEELGQFATHIDQSLADSQIVLRIVVNTLCVLGHIHLST